MANATISVVVERVTAIIEEQIRSQVNLVRGVEKEVLNLSHELKSIRNVLDDAERREFKDKSIKDWLKRLEDASYEMDDVLDEWEIAILKLKMKHEYSNNVAVAPPKQKVWPSILSSCLCFKKVVVRHDIAKKIKNMKEQLDLILAEKDRYNFVTSQPTDLSLELSRVQSTSLIDLAEVHGRDSDTSILIGKLMAAGDSQRELSIQILSIVGVGGLGKTTLAQRVYNDDRVKEYFELRIWICVSDSFDVAGIAQEIIKILKEGSSPNTNQLDMLVKHVTESISGKKFLLVLDDVWTEDYKKWEPLKNSLKYGGAGSKILVTTRNERVAKMMGTRDNEIHHLGQLSNEDCWLVLCRMALFGRNVEEVEKFQDIGKKIANKCKGLPLAAKVLGGLLRYKNSLEEWENVLNNEIWQLEEAEVELFPHLLLSYNELSPALKRCFSYCAIFPKGYKINVKRDLIENWTAQGYIGYNIGSHCDMDLRGRDHFNILAMHSLFQDFKKNDMNGRIISCKMHDIVHDFAQYLRKNRSNGSMEAARKKTTGCEVCDASLVSNVKEYRTLFFKEKCLPDFCDCLTSVRVLIIRRCVIPRGIENLIHLRRLELSEKKLSREDTKSICKIYNVQFLRLERCELQEIPVEIGNLKYLRHLLLRGNYNLLELPDSICGLLELQTLNIEDCERLCGLPEGIHRLINLKHLHNSCTFSLEQFPQGLAQLTGLRTLTEFRGGREWNKLGLLKNFNCLSGFLRLLISLTNDLEDVVADAREAELRKKIHIQQLMIIFEDKMDEKESSSSIRMDVIDALEPHPNLRELRIWYYKGSKLPRWITSPLSQLRHVSLLGFSHLSLLPPLGKLPCLEEIYVAGMGELQFVGREFLGTTMTIGGDDMRIESSSSSSSSSVAAAAATNSVAFPRLKKLIFEDCPSWKEWEDIIEAEEEESPDVSLMPCLTILIIKRCKVLMALPHRLLRKASSLERLGIFESDALQKRYGDKDSCPWKSISHVAGGFWIDFSKASLSGD